MRAVNLVPADARRGGQGARGASVPAYLVIAVLALALGLVTVYVLTNNTISSRRAKLTALQAQTAQVQARAEGLGAYTQFAQLAQTRAQTVRAIAATRFDWYSAMSDLSKVVPANTSLQSLVGTVVPGANAAGGSSGATGSSGTLRAAGSGPAFELTGCTQSQDAVAGLMSRLRLVNGVTRVTLEQSQKAQAAQSASTGASTATQGCPASYPTFNLVVFFQPVPGAGPSGPTTLPVSATGASK